MEIAKVISVSKPLTFKEIFEQEWVVGNRTMDGLEMILWDTIANMDEWISDDEWLEYDFDEEKIVVSKIRNGDGWYKMETMATWTLEDAKEVFQSFYYKPINWDKQKWIVIILKLVKSGNPIRKLRFSDDYLKFNEFIFTTIRKVGSKSSQFKNGDIVEIDHKITKKQTFK